jgi:hypothetical protein
MTISITPYETRPIRFLELWQHDEWRFKVYGIAYRREVPRPELVEAAKTAARARLAAVDKSMEHYGVGFLGIHDARTANFIFVDWWADENELHHHVYVSPSDEPSRLTYAPTTCGIACVWDLRVMEFHRQAWLNAVLKRPQGQDLDEYLLLRINEDV